MAEGNCEFNGSGGQYFLTVILHLFILTMLTCGIYAPWAWVKIFQLKASHTTMRGRQVVFTGTGGDLLILTIVQGLLIVVTLGFYTPWAICKFLGWKAENTLVGDRPSQFNGTGGSLFLFYMIHLLILPLITLGLYYLYGIYRFYAWKEENTLYGGEKTSFGGRFWDFLKISLITWILNGLTLSLFMPWALAMLYRWQVEGLAVGPDASVDHFEPAKTNLAFAAALVLIALAPILAFTFYAKNQYDKFTGMAQAAKMMQMHAESPRTTIKLGPSVPKHSPPPSQAFRKESVGKVTIKSDGTASVQESRKPGSSFSRAWLHASKGDFQQAEREYTQAIERNPKDRDAYYNRGLVYVQLKEYDRACQDFEAALALDPKFIEAYCNRGNAHFQAGRPELAVKDYDQAIRLNPKDGDVYFNRGVALLSMGKEAQATEDFRKAAALGQKKAKAQLAAAPMRAQ
jgi:tetratricopeptide (TPR) repeat protein